MTAESESTKTSPKPPCHLRPGTSPSVLRLLIKLQAGSGSLSRQPDKPRSHLLKGSHVKKPGHATDNAEILGVG